MRSLATVRQDHDLGRTFFFFMSGSPTRCAGRQADKRDCNKLLWIQSMRPFDKSLDVSCERFRSVSQFKKVNRLILRSRRMHDSFR